MCYFEISMLTEDALTEQNVKIKVEVKCKLCLSITTSIAKNASNSCIYPDVGLLDAIGKDCCNI